MNRRENTGLTTMLLLHKARPNSLICGASLTLNGAVVSWTPRLGAGISACATLVHRIYQLCLFVGKIEGFQELAATVCRVFVFRHERPPPTSLVRGDVPFGFRRSTHSENVLFPSACLLRLRFSSSHCHIVSFRSSLLLLRSHPPTQGVQLYKSGSGLGY